MATQQGFRRASIEDQKRTDATKARDQAFTDEIERRAGVQGQSRLPAQAAPAQAAPAQAAPAQAAATAQPAAGSASRLPIDEAIKRYGIATGTPSTPRAVGYQEAGFSSQAEYDAAKAGPQTAGVPSGTATIGGRDASTIVASPEFQARQAAAQEKADAQWKVEQSRLPPPLTTEMGYAIGAATRQARREQIQKELTRDAGSMFGPNPATQQSLKDSLGRLDSADAEAAAYQKAHPITRETRVAEAKRNGTFDTIRERYNKTHGASHFMDESGAVHELDDATKTKLAVSSAAAKAAALKDQHTQAKSLYEFQNARLKNLIGSIKAEDMAKKGSPASVGGRVAAILGGPQTLQAQPTAPQTLQAQPTAPQTLQAQPTAPQTLQAQPTAPQTLQAQPTAPQTLQATGEPSFSRTANLLGAAAKNAWDMSGRILKTGRLP